MNTLSKWYKTELGRRVMEYEQSALAAELPQTCGNFLWQIGGPEVVDFSIDSPILHHYRLDITQTSRATADVVRCSPDALPLVQNRSDLIMLIHALEQVDDPRALVHEACHALAIDGKLMVMGFNPWSMWGMKRFFGKEKDFPWQKSFLSPNRVISWLNEFGFVDHELKTFFFRPPVKGLDRIESLLFCEPLGEFCWPKWGAVYLLVAKKSVSTLTPVKPARRWAKKAMPANAASIEPTSRIIVNE